ncbi:MAG: PadR family transcriptional regulator [bacterium]|nr:PadR family transcriptional regulator [bacterium]
MKILTRVEEFILLSVMHLKEDAYSLPIQKKISEISGEHWSLGTIYAPLDRLEKKKYLESYLSETTPERGGRQKRIYRVTNDGLKVLKKTQEAHNQMWENIGEPELKVKRS